MNVINFKGEFNWTDLHRPSVVQASTPHCSVFFPPTRGCELVSLPPFLPPSLLSERDTLFHTTEACSPSINASLCCVFPPSLAQDNEVHGSKVWPNLLLFLQAHGERECSALMNNYRNSRNFKFQKFPMLKGNHIFNCVLMCTRAFAYSFAYNMGMAVLNFSKFPKISEVSYVMPYVHVNTCCRAVKLPILHSARILLTALATYSAWNSAGRFGQTHNGSVVKLGSYHPLFHPCRRFLSMPPCLCFTLWAGFSLA